MDQYAIVQYICNMFDDVQIETSDGNSFFFYGDERKLPFATLVTKDDYDTFSNLSRPSVFRLNIGIGKGTFQSLFAQEELSPGESGDTDNGFDFTTLDQLLPHPVYGKMYWVCVLNPSHSTFQTVRTLLDESYRIAAGRHPSRHAFD